MTMAALFEAMGDALTDTGGIAVHDPADGSLVAQVVDHDVDSVSAIVDAADVARRDWSAQTAQARAIVLRRWFDAVNDHADALAEIMTRESGKPLAEARGEVRYGAAFIEWFAEEGKRAYGDVIPGFSPTSRVLTLRQPVGTCAAITPWNFPVAMVTRKVAPALAAGCSIVVKPANATPLSALALEALAHRAGVPRDLFRVVPARRSGAIGELLCQHPVIRKLSFTGSTRVGQVLMAQAAENVLRLSLELGGNAPFIVFDDADIDAAVTGLIASKFRNAGQTCVCANRVLVQDGIHDAFAARLAEAIGRFRVGPGLSADTDIGPLIDGKAAGDVRALVEDAVASGARVAATATAPDAPAFYPPTLMTGVTMDMRIAQEEIFGPVATLIRFADEAEAIRLANATPYGLAAYLYSRDIGRIWRMMEAIEAGMVAVNEGVLSSEVAPFGGVKHSGFGREGSHLGLSEYLEVKYALLGGLAA